MAVEKKNSVPQCTEHGDATSERFYAVTDIADMLSVSIRTVRRWINQRQLAAHKFGRTVRVAESDLRLFLSQTRCH